MRISLKLCTICSPNVQLLRPETVAGFLTQESAEDSKVKSNDVDECESIKSITLKQKQRALRKQGRFVNIRIV